MSAADAGTATDLAALGASYAEHLQRVVLPFWLTEAVDREHGGFLTCFDNRGRTLVSTDKYTWSQGRFVWLLARAADLARRGLLDLDADELLSAARTGAEFVLGHAPLAEGGYAFSLSREGVLREGHTSVFADCFVVLGLAELARVTGDDRLLERALRSYDQVSAEIDAGRALTAPYPVPAGHRAYSLAMIMLNVSLELAEALRTTGHPRADAVWEQAQRHLADIMTVFRQPPAVAELVPAPGVPGDTLLARHRTPGHTIEGMWFALHAARRAGRTDVMREACRVIAEACAIGWDEEYGGLLRYVDRDGGRPRGDAGDDPYGQLVVDTWDTKLWWPHAEALYATLLGRLWCGDDELAAWHRRVHDYTFATFPAAPDEGREWIQIRDRAGRPLEKVVALPVKDPFHVARSLLLLVELLGRTPD
ncbi:MAG TPA: AGE family epimerase/isomerase [Streptosporangiales bacterium]